MSLIKLKERGREVVNLGRRNLIINGDMKISQRGTVASLTNGYGGADRFQFGRSGSAVVTLSKNTDVPTAQGFTSSQKVDVTTADSSLAAGDYAFLRTKIEGQNLQHLLYGTSSAKKVTLQFFVKSSKTGTHIVELYHGDVNYFNSQAYTIASANTWQKVTLTFDGYQPSVINNDNGIGFQIAWWLAAGSTYTSGTLSSNTWHNDAAGRAPGQVNVMDNTANNFYLTGVQLEVGDTSTDFEHRSFAEELALCQRYYVNHGLGSNADAVVSPGRDAQYTHIRGTQVQFPVAMRNAPTVIIQSGSANSMDRYGRGQETCYPLAEGITTFGFGVVRSRDSGGNNRNWTDNGLYINRAGYSAEAEL